MIKIKSKSTVKQKMFLNRVNDLEMLEKPPQLVTAIHQQEQATIGQILQELEVIVLQGLELTILQETPQLEAVIFLEEVAHLLEEVLLQAEVHHPEVIPKKGVKI